MKAFGQYLWDGWMKFAHVIGEINQYILLAIVYFLFIGIYAVLAWPLMIFRKEKATAWQESLPPETKEQLTRPF